MARRRNEDPFAGKTLEELIGYCRDLSLLQMPGEHRKLLSELGLRLDVPADALGLVRLRSEKEGGRKAYVWAAWNQDRVAALRAVPGHRWNQTCRANTYIVEEPISDSVVLAGLAGLFRKILMVLPDGHQVVDGVAGAEQLTAPAYELLPMAREVTLANVLDSFQGLRPDDHAERLALHGEIDDEFRSLFQDNLPVVSPETRAVRFKTRHPMLLFRISVSHGQPRYALYDVGHEEVREVSFASNRECRRWIAQAKEAMEVLRHPIVELHPGL